MNTPSRIRSNVFAVDWNLNSFQISKLATGGHFEENISLKFKLHIDLKWREM